MTFLLCLHLHYSLNIIFMLERCSTTAESVHSCLNAYCFQHSSVEILCRPGYITNKVPNYTKLIYLWFIFLECILKIWTLASSLGKGNYIFLSNLPDLIKAGSKTSGLLVAQITLISSLGENLYKQEFTHLNDSVIIT